MFEYEALGRDAINVQQILLLSKSRKATQQQKQRKISHTQALVLGKIQFKDNYKFSGIGVFFPQWYVLVSEWIEMASEWWLTHLTQPAAPLLETIVAVIKSG
jgi:hypothetical protein